MNITTILLFFVYLWGLGYSATYFLKRKSGDDKNQTADFWESNFMRLGIGLGIFLLLAVIFNLVKIPLDWKVFLVVSLILPIYSLIKHFSKNNFDLTAHLKKFKFSKAELYLLIVLLLFAFTFYMYHQGAFKYPYLEDDDPWEHARSVKYIATEKTALEPYPDQDLFRYLDPYPPSYDILMAVLYQTNDSINWTLKFFNALIISLSIIIFYFFATKFMKSRKKALFATVVLTAIPSYLSHFIWTHSLLPILIMTAFYCLEKIDENKNARGDEEGKEEGKNVKNKWWLVSAFIIGGIFVTHPEHAVKFTLFFVIYGAIKWLFEKKLPLEHLYAFLLGGVLSLSWWALKVGSFFQERVGRIAHLDAGLVSEKTSLFYKIISFIQHYFQPKSGTATRVYNFQDFFTAQYANMINNPIGWGVVITLLTIFSVIIVLILTKKYYTSKTYYPLVTLGWLLLTFLIVNSMTFNLPGLFGFRTWLLLALPVAIICAEGFSNLLQFIPSSIKCGKIVLIILVVLGLWYTAGAQKYTVNTAMWPPGASWTSMEEVQLYLWVGSNVPKNTKVMDFSGSQNNEMIGMDMDNCDWCAENMVLRKDFLNKTLAQVYTFLKQNGYEYLILDGGRSIRAFETQLGSAENSQKVVLEKFKEYLANGKFSVAYQNQGGVVLKVN